MVNLKGGIVLVVSFLSILLASELEFFEPIYFHTDGSLHIYFILQMNWIFRYVKDVGQESRNVG